MTDLQDKCIATLWGLHIGDAIWAPFETKTMSEVAEWVMRSEKLHFFTYENPWPEDGNGRFLPAGRPTDDSDQAADLCHSLLQCDGLDPEHLRRSLRNSVVRGVSRLWTGQATGAGKTTRAMLGDDEEKRAKILAQPYASNGSLMRSAPLALWLGPHGPNTPEHSDGPAYQLVRAMSEVTHTHPNSVAACWLYIRMLRRVLAEQDLREVEPHNDFDQRILEHIAEVEHHGCPPSDPGSFKNGWGAAEYTLKVALWAFLTTDTFTDCINKVGSVGGDTDTYGAVAGALAGAYYGTTAIPPEWRDTILGRDQMREYATGIYQIRYTRA